jgi:hypothetical protein
VAQDNGDAAGSATGVTGVVTGPIGNVRSEAIRTGGEQPARPRPPRIPIGAELPLFCERCGYSLNALPQVTCEHCSVLQFHCPECGHHQPINTLRPALQRTLGRLRAFSVGLIAFLKLNWFGWHLFFWVLMGYEWAYSYNYRSSQVEPLWPSLEAVLAFGIYGMVIGSFSRLMLLRWRSGALVGVVLGALFCTMLAVGFHWRVAGRDWDGNTNLDPVLTAGRLLMMLLTFSVITLSAMAAWPVWVGFVRVAMPERAGTVLLDWQRSLSDPAEKARLADQR